MISVILPKMKKKPLSVTLFNARYQLVAASLACLAFVVLLSGIALDPSRSIHGSPVEFVDPGQQVRTHLRETNFTDGLDVKSEGTRGQVGVGMGDERFKSDRGRPNVHKVSQAQPATKDPVGGNVTTVQDSTQQQPQDDTWPAWFRDAMSAVEILDVELMAPVVDRLVKERYDEAHLRWSLREAILRAMGQGGSEGTHSGRRRETGYDAAIHGTPGQQGLGPQFSMNMSFSAAPRPLPPGALEIFLNGTVHALFSTRLIYGRCYQNDTALFDDTGLGALVSWLPGESKYGFVANLKTSEHLMPNFIVQVLLLSTYLPAHKLYVSIYESNSADKTADWLELLEIMLQLRGVPHTIVTNGKFKGNIKKQRIKTLARVRNIALAPLFGNHVTPGPLLPMEDDEQEEDSRSGLEDVTEVGSNSSTSQGNSTIGNSVRDLLESAPQPPPFDPDYLFFVNDVYFCAHDFIRLSKHKASISCGIDLNTPAWQDPIHPRRSRSLRTWMDFKEDGEDPILMLYDIWVDRDLHGSRMFQSEGFTRDRKTFDRFSLGLPAPVYCCWNGIVVLDSGPFRRGVRFRSNLEGECSASECSLLCDDYHRLGYNKVVMDPSVYVAYDWHVASRLSKTGVDKTGWFQPLPLGQSTWSQVLTAPHYTSLGTAKTHRVECCDLEPNNHFVDFAACRAVDVMKTNFTDQYLKHDGPQ